MSGPGSVLEPKPVPGNAGTSLEPVADGFITSNLNLPDMEESTAEAPISVMVTNTGAIEKTHKLELVVDGDVVASQNITLPSGASRNVTFVIWLGTPGVHMVKIGQVSGELFWIGQN